MNIQHHSRMIIAAAVAFGMSVLPHVARAVDGVVLITQARAIAGGITPGDAPGFPVTISEPGSYRLASNLQVSQPNVAAIDLVTTHIDLDLNGFTISGPGKGVGTASGIEGHPGGGATGAAVSIRNGYVREMGGHGISIDSTTTVDNVRSLGNGMDGMILTTGARILNSEANDNGRHGFRILVGQIMHSNATANGESGVYIEYGSSLVSDNVLERNGTWGIYANTVGFGGPSAYKGNVMFGNGSGSVSGTLVELGPNLCGGATACP